MEGHINWKQKYFEYIEKIYQILKINDKPKIYVSKRGYVSFVISKKEIIKKLSKSIFDLGLPILDRKWNRIKENEYYE